MCGFKRTCGRSCLGHEKGGMQSLFEKSSDIVKLIGSNLDDLSHLYMLRSVNKCCLEAMQGIIMHVCNPWIRIAPRIPIRGQTEPSLHPNVFKTCMQWSRPQRLFIARRFSEMLAYSASFFHHAPGGSDIGHFVDIHLDAATDCVQTNHSILQFFFRYNPSTSLETVGMYGIMYMPSVTTSRNTEPLYERKSRTVRSRFSGSGTVQTVLCKCDESEPVNGFLPHTSKIASLSLYEGNTQQCIPFPTLQKVFEYRHLQCLSFDHSLCSQRLMSFLDAYQADILFPSLESLSWRNGFMTARFFNRLLVVLTRRPAGLKYINVDYNIIGVTYHDFRGTMRTGRQALFPRNSACLLRLSMRNNLLDKETLSIVIHDFVLCVCTRKAEMWAKEESAQAATRWCTGALFFEPYYTPASYRSTLEEYFYSSALQITKSVSRHLNIPMRSASGEGPYQEGVHIEDMVNLMFDSKDEVKHTILRKALLRH